MTSITSGLIDRDSMGKYVHEVASFLIITILPCYQRTSMKKIIIITGTVRPNTQKTGFAAVFKEEKGRALRYNFTKYPFFSDYSVLLFTTNYCVGTRTEVLI